MENIAKFASAQQCRAFILAGNARLTLRSTATGARFTYRISKPKEDDDRPHRGPEVFFVSLMSGADNESAFQYLGVIRAGQGGHRYEHGRKSKISAEAKGAVAFAWFASQLFFANRLSPTVEAWHEGRCGRCGRPLTVPESIESGFGPECITKVCEAA
jgi:hypothetical protein